jgi:hypothetical protein
VIPDGAKLCPHCLKIKPTGAFWRKRTAGGFGPASWCKVCSRIGRVAALSTPEARAREAEYRVRPEVKARRAEAARRDYHRRKAEMRARASTPRRRLIVCRSYAVCRLREAADPARRARLLHLIDLHERELDRIDAASGLPRRWRPLDAAAACERRATC